MAVAQDLVLYGQLPQEIFSWVEGSEKAPSEVLIEGPAGTGKTHTILQALLEYGERYPRSKIVFLRNERASMSETLLPEWEEHVLGPEHPSVLGGPQRKDREKYTLPNGSEYILRGFDNEQKLFSGQYHVIFFNEATELKSEEKFETLHRAKRALCDGGQPFRSIIADCNPRQRLHWLNVRASPGRDGSPAKMHRIRTALHDNPRWYDHELAEWTQDGHDYISSMAAGYTGVNRSRLLLGLWEDASGALMAEFNQHIHCIDARLERATGTWLLHVKGWAQPVELRWFFAGFDAGYTTACLGVWGVDIQGRMFEVAELYRSRWAQNGDRTGWTHDDWARRAVGLAREFQLQGIVSDHDPSLIEAVNRALINAGHGACVREADKRMGMAGDKAKAARIEMMRARFQRNELFFVNGCNREVDNQLLAKGRPNKTPDELPNLRYREFEYGVDDIAVEGKVDKTIPDHGFDMCCYSVVFAAGRQVQGKRTIGSSPWERYWDGDWKGFAKAR